MNSVIAMDKVVRERKSSTKIASIGLAACLAAVLSATAGAAPSVTAADGKFDHKASVTITGSGFGTKASAAPVIWDDASGSDILSKWDLATPNTNAAYNLNYRAPQRGIALPHDHITKYIAGG